MVGSEARERREVRTSLVTQPKNYYWEYGCVYIIDVLKQLFRVKGNARAVRQKCIGGLVREYPHRS